MGSAMTCPDCGAQVRGGADLAAGRRVHRLSVRDDGAVDIYRRETVTLWHCGVCDLVVGVGDRSR